MTHSNITTNAGYEFKYTDLPYITIGAFGAVSNVLLLVVFIKDPLKCFGNSGTYLVISLAVSDFLTCLSNSFPHNTTGNEIHLFFLYWFACASLASLGSVSIDRFLMVTYPIKYRILINGKVMALWLGTIWTVSCVNSAMVWFSDASQAVTGNILHILNATIITISAVIYASTYHKLKKQSRSIALTNSHENHAQAKRILKEKRFLNTIIILACIAFVSIAPTSILWVIYTSIELHNIGILGWVFLAIFYMNFAVNPWVYILRLPNYRKTFYLVYCRRKTSSS